MINVLSVRAELRRMTRYPPENSDETGANKMGLAMSWALTRR